MYTFFLFFSMLKGLKFSRVIFTLSIVSSLTRLCSRLYECTMTCLTWSWTMWWDPYIPGNRPLPAEEDSGLIMFVSVYLSLYVCLSASVCLYVCLCMSVCLYVCLSSVCLCMSVCLSLYICLSVSVYLFVCLCMSVCLSLYVCLSVSICLFVCLYMSVCLSVCFQGFHREGDSE